MSFMGRVYWFFEYFSNFRLQYFILHLLLLVILIILKPRGRFNFIFLIFVLMNSIPLISLYIPPEYNKKEAKTSIKILLANVLSNNRNYEHFYYYIQEIDPDFIMLLEVTDAWVKNLEKLENNYNFAKYPREDNFGIAMYSKYPFLSSHIAFYGSLNLPTIKGEILVENKIIKFTGTHPIPPKNKKYMAFRNEQLMEIAEEIGKDKEKNNILLGDFNLTPWSPDFSDIMKFSGLRDTGQGFGLQPTWPTYKPLMIIPIDHCLLGEDFVVLDRYVGKSIGSDHYPVILEIGW